MKKTIFSIATTMLSLASFLPAFAGCSEKDGPHEDEYLLEEIPAEPGRIVIAYVRAWSQTMPDPSRMTHINYAFGHVASTFNAVEIDNESRLRSIAALKSVNPDLKILLSIGGWASGNFSEMAASETLRKAFAKDCAAKVAEFGIDGIDIDWEYPTSSAAGIVSSPADKANFTLLMRDLRLALGRDKLLTFATICSAQFINFAGVLPYVNFINIMSYDLGYAPVHNAPLFDTDSEGRKSAIAGTWSCAKSVEAHLRAGVPEGKLVMGMPLYGRGNNVEYPNSINYRDLSGPKEGHSELWDEIARVPYYADENGNMLFGFDNVRSIEEKCDYIVEKGLKGGMYWEYSQDSDDGDLTLAIASKLLQSAE